MTQADKEPLVCTVDRKTWKRGVKQLGLYMVNKDGTKCCLGFLGEACGIPSKRLHQAMPLYLDLDDYDKYPTNVNWYQFSRVNDNPSITDEERENELQQLAELNGFRFVFVG